MNAKHYEYGIVLQPEPEGGYTVTVPALPGCITYGEDYEQALAMAQECIEGFLEALIKAGMPIPEEPDSSPLVRIIQVKVPA